MVKGVSRFCWVAVLSTVGEGCGVVVAAPLLSRLLKDGIVLMDGMVGIVAMLGGAALGVAGGVVTVCLTVAVGC